VLAIGQPCRWHPPYPRFRLFAETPIHHFSTAPRRWNALAHVHPCTQIFQFSIGFRASTSKPLSDYFPVTIQGVARQLENSTALSGGIAARLKILHAVNHTKTAIGANDHSGLLLPKVNKNDFFGS